MYPFAGDSEPCCDLRSTCYEWVMMVVVRWNCAGRRKWNISSKFWIYISQPETPKGFILYHLPPDILCIQYLMYNVHTQYFKTVFIRQSNVSSDTLRSTIWWYSQTQKQITNNQWRLVVGSSHLEFVILTDTTCILALRDRTGNIKSITTPWGSRIDKRRHQSI